MPPTDQAQWFSEQVQPHEPALRAYLSKRFPALPDHDDLVQETYIRTLRAHAGGRVTHARAFLFTAARNAAIDLFRRRRGQDHEEISEIHALPALEEAPGLGDTAEHEQRLDALLEAILTRDREGPHDQGRQGLHPLLPPTRPPRRRQSLRR